MSATVRSRLGAPIRVNLSEKSSRGPFPRDRFLSADRGIQGAVIKVVTSVQVGIGDQKPQPNPVPEPKKLAAPMVTGAEPGGKFHDPLWNLTLICIYVSGT